MSQWQGAVPGLDVGLEGSKHPDPGTRTQGYKLCLPGAVRGGAFPKAEGV